MPTPTVIEDSSFHQQLLTSCNPSGRFDSPFTAQRVLKKASTKRKYANKHRRLTIKHCRQCGGYHIRSESTLHRKQLTAKSRLRRVSF